MVLWSSKPVKYLSSERSHAAPTELAGTCRTGNYKQDAPIGAFLSARLPLCAPLPICAGLRLLVHTLGTTKRPRIYNRLRERYRGILPPVRVSRAVERLQSEDRQTEFQPTLPALGPNHHIRNCYHPYFS